MNKKSIILPLLLLVGNISLSVSPFAVLLAAQVAATSTSGPYNWVVQFVGAEELSSESDPDLYSHCHIKGGAVLGNRCYWLELEAEGPSEEQGAVYPEEPGTAVGYYYPDSHNFFSQ